jgi:RNA polymerase sigma-70 factor (ECF subfamily)
MIYRFKDAAAANAQYLDRATGGRGVELTDGEALARSLAGDPDVFTMLVRRHGQAVHGYLLRRSNRQTADDLLGEVWLRAFRSRGGYDQVWSSARPWLYGIARNTLREHWRVGTAEADELFEVGHDPWPDIDDRLDAVRHRSALREALGELCSEDREVLLLVAWEHLTPAEVSVSLGIPQGTTRWRLHRARTVLQGRLAGDIPVRSSLPYSKEA